MRLAVCIVAIWTSALFSSPAARSSLAADGKRVSFEIVVSAGKHDRRNTPVQAVVQLPQWLMPVVKLTGPGGKVVPAQLVPPALLQSSGKGEPGTQPLALCWTVPQLSAGESAEYRATIEAGGVAASNNPAAETTPAASADFFRWKDEPGQHRDLLLGERPVARYMYHAYENHPEKRDLNNKPFHHLFSPAGDRLVTKGSGGHYTHHQGLFYGFTRCTFDGDAGKCNTWYCHDGEHQLHTEFIEETAGPVLARHRVSIDWNDRKADPFCRETRELTAYNLPGGTLVEWSSHLASVRGDVTLDGDAQHAGFQFRAADEVASATAKQTYYLRPDGKGEPGETINPSRGQEFADTEDPATRRVMDLPWNVMSFVLADTRYSAAYIDHPGNPKPSFYSERDYGRFGSWFGKQELKQDGPTIAIRYRIWLQEGEMTPSQAHALSTDFADPPQTTVTVIDQ